MDWSFLSSRRCLRCGTPTPGGDASLCRPCGARLQPRGPGTPGGPGVCRLCGQPLLAEQGLCTDCAGVPWSFRGLEGLGTYQEPAAELVRLYKFGGLTALHRLFEAAAGRVLDPPGPLVPVPPLRRHLHRRGWDPVDSWTRALGRRSGLPVWRALVRRPSASQKDLGRSQRAANAAAAYTLAPRLPRGLGGTEVVWLIDDVVTTGATAEACARLLRSAGAGEVRVLCLGLH